MARKATWREPVGPSTREFTPAELDRIRELTAAIPGIADGHPAWQVRELDRLHEATGHVRKFKLWELGNAHEHDADAAYLEEIRQHSRGELSR